MILIGSFSLVKFADKVHFKSVTLFLRKCHQTSGKKKKSIRAKKKKNISRTEVEVLREKQRSDLSVAIEGADLPDRLF